MCNSTGSIMTQWHQQVVEQYLLLALIAIAQQEGGAHAGLELQHGSLCSGRIQSKQPLRCDTLAQHPKHIEDSLSRAE